MSSSQPIGLMLNNPGNIRKNDGVMYNGEVRPSSNSAFKEFKDMPHGYRAMASLLYHYIISSGLNTINKILTVYAPAADGNNPVNYANFVASQVGIQPDYVLSKSDFTSFFGDPTVMKIIRAMEQEEEGVKADENDLQTGFNLFLNDQGLA